MDIIDSITDKIFEETKSASETIETGLESSNDCNQAADCNLTSDYNQTVWLSD